MATSSGYQGFVQTDDDAERGTSPQALDIVQLPAEDMMEDTYSMTVCAMVRDAHFLAKGDKALPIRIGRLGLTLALLFLTIGIQVFVLTKLKKFVSAKAVHDIREAYDLYEVTVYGNTSSHLHTTVNGLHRGVREDFPGVKVARERFKKLDEDRQGDVCRIPMSQPMFFFSILLIWTIACIAEWRTCVHSFICVIVLTERTDDMGKAMLEAEGSSEDSKDRVIGRLTLKMKVLITLLCFVPRVLITAYLWWLGCRWLLATNDFENLILNAVALEFILLLKDGVYVALMPHRNKVDLANTKIKPHATIAVFRNEECHELCQTISWFSFAVLVVYLYIFHLQQVLPMYNWDVHEVCTEYIDEAYKV